MISLSEFDYDLPEQLIAQKPLRERDQSRLLLLNRNTGKLFHHRFCDIYDFLLPGDVLVINNTQVIPGRLLGKKASGGNVEVLLLGYEKGHTGSAEPGVFICDCLVKASKPSKPGTRLFFDKRLTGEILSGQQGIYTIRFTFEGDFESLLYRIGQVPLPPYIRRPRADNEIEDKYAYQTVYASEKGAIAAPTAGLHFTRLLLDNLQKKSVKIAPITLHVGYGTFSPVRAADIRDHRLHSEPYYISRKSADMINTSKEAGARIIAVGTTCVRTLEYAVNDHGATVPGRGECDLFIYPGYAFKMIDGMITNFHLPKSSLLMLVSAFAGLDRLMAAYREAIEHEYRFYSYGDAMLII